MESFYAQGGLLILLPLCTMYRGGGGGRTVYNPTLFLLSLLRATDEISSPERRRVAASLSGDGGRRRRRRRKSRSIFRGGGSKKGGRGGGYLSFPDTRNRGKYSIHCERDYRRNQDAVTKLRNASKESAHVSGKRKCKVAVWINTHFCFLFHLILT